MRTSKTIARLKAGEPVRMCALGHYIPAYVRHAAHFGFDCIWLDAEHRAWATRELEALLAMCHTHDIDCMLRPPTLEKTRLYRYLEDGAAGLMIPHVSTAEKARMLVDAVKFPPLGGRGLDGAGRDSDFFFQGTGDFTDKANAETFLVVQIETPEAVANAAEIAAVPGVDVLFVGPGDLGLRLRHDTSGLTLEQAMLQVAEAAATHGKAWGCPAGSAEEIRHRREQGAQLIAHGGDFMAMHEMLKKSCATFTEAYGE